MTRIHINTYILAIAGKTFWPEKGTLLDYITSQLPNFQKDTQTKSNTICT